MNSLSKETLKKYREVAFDCKPEMAAGAEKQGLFKGENPCWKVTEAYRNNYDQIQWDSH